MKRKRRVLKKIVNRYKYYPWMHQSQVNQIPIRYVSWLLAHGLLHRRGEMYSFYPERLDYLEKALKWADEMLDFHGNLKQTEVKNEEAPIEKTSE